MGSMISVEHAGKVKSRIERALASGVRLLAGGNERMDLGPSFVEPTILTDVNDDMRISKEETFDPSWPYTACEPPKKRFASICRWAV